MARSAAFPLSQAFTYDFNKDGGALGPITTGIQFPVNAQFISAYVYVITQVTFTAGATTMAVGTATTGTLIVPTTVIGPGAKAKGAVLFSAVYAAASIRVMDATLNVLFTIGVDTITAGKIGCIINYTFLE